MERDLYGEMLSRALNRGAPQGHFAAYITPQEGGVLRDMGGGVAPNGGQLMANGIPSFQEFGGVDPGINDPTGPTGGYGSAPGGRGSQGAGGGVSGGGDDTSFDDMFTAPVSVPAVPETTHERAARNIERAINNPSLYNKNTSTWTEAGVAELGRDISKGGAGSQSPASIAARNNPSLTAQQTQSINQHSDRTGGYSINDPYSGVSVPAGINMGPIPAVMGSLFGLMNPAMSLGLTFSGVPTLMNMARDFAIADTGALGTAARGIQQNFTDFTQPVRDFVQPARDLGARIGTGVRDAASGIGDFLTEQVVDPVTGQITDVVSNIGQSLPSVPGLQDVLSSTDFSIDQPNVQQGSGNQDAPVPVVAPINEVVNPGAAPTPERQFAEIPLDILARILANQEFGRQRIGSV